MVARLRFAHLGPCLILVLSACFSPKSPQDVTQAFWDGVLNKDLNDVVKYSSLVDAKQYDGFSKEWDGYQPSWGKVVIDGKEASVETRFSRPGGAKEDKREFVTHLVQRNEQWIVDYARTHEEVRGGLIGSFLGKLEEVGKELTDQLEIAAEEFSAEMERFAGEIENYANSAERGGNAGIEEFAQVLQQYLRELERSVQQALEQHRGQLSDRDQGIMREILTQLEHDLDKLSEANAIVVAEGSKNLAKMIRQLESLDTKVLHEYRQQWHLWSKEVEKNSRRMLDRLSAGAQAL